MRNHTVFGRIASALCIGLLVYMAAQAEPMPAGARAEVMDLLGHLEKSGCEFQRNSSWYSGAEAKTHLLRKLDYFEKKATLQTAEQFIESAASSSSASGQPYQVRCPNTAATPSQTWLTTQLRQMRASKVPVK